MREEIRRLRKEQEETTAQQQDTTAHQRAIQKLREELHQVAIQAGQARNCADAVYVRVLAVQNQLDALQAKLKQPRRKRNVR